MTEEWRRQMQQKMADYEESDIDLSWPEIEKALEANRRNPLFRRIAAAAVVLLLAGVGYWTLQRQTPEAVVVENHGTTPSSLPPQQGKVGEESPDHGDRSVIRAVAGVKRLVPVIVPAPATITETTEDEPLLANQEPDEPKEQTADGASNQSTDSHGDGQPDSQKPVPVTAVIYPYELFRKTSSHSRLTAKVYFSNATTGYSSQMSGFQRIPIPKGDDEPTLDPTPDKPGGTEYDVDPPGGNDGPGGDEDPGGYPEDDPSGEGGTDQQEGDTGEQEGDTRQSEPQQYRTQQTNETARHHQPVRFGLSLRYRLNDHWSIESGLTYTRLSADFTRAVDDKSVTTEQRLNYIGIPVTASYMVWGSRFVNVYVSAGAMVEKMVSGSRTTAGETTSVSIHPLQFSLNGAAGAEIRFSPQFSLYAEPGIGYWFDNGSSIPTYYQERPLSFSLSLGLRVSPW